MNPTGLLHLLCVHLAIIYTMASWLQNQIRAAEGILEAVDRTAKNVSKKDQLDVTKARASENFGHAATSPAQISPYHSAPKSWVADAPERQSVAEGQWHSKTQGNDPEAGAAEPSAITIAERPNTMAAGESVSGSKEAALGLSDGATSGMQEPDITEQQTSADLSSDMPPLASLFGSSRSNSGEAASPSQGAAHVQAHAREHAEQVCSVPAGIEDEKSKSRLQQASNSQPVGAESFKPLAVPSAGDTSRKQQPDKAKSSEREEVPQRPAATPESAPPNTADAVAKAIKAASAATEGPEAGEELEGVVDASVREARLARMVDNLKRRLERLKAENEQLEEMLQQADAKVSGRVGDIEKLEDTLAEARAAEGAARAQLVEAQEQQQVECRSRDAALEVANARLAEQQARLAATEEDNAKLLQEREMSEARMLAALRDEVANMERRLEDERFAAASARQSFSAREQELEATLSESAASLASQQRAMDEKARRLVAVESKAAALETERDELRTRLEEALTSRHDTDALSNHASRSQQVKELQEGVASLQAALSSSQTHKHSLERELSQLRVDFEGLQHQAAHSVSPAEMEQRLREVTELLYQKQSQLEKVAAERAAQQMAWEREVASLREDADRSRRRSRTDRAMNLMDGDLVVPMEDMGETYQKLANNKRVGGAVKAGARLLDATTLTAVRFLRQYPLGRLVVFGYLVFIHLFVYMLIHNLQQRALHVEHSALRLDDNS